MTQPSTSDARSDQLSWKRRNGYWWQLRLRLRFTHALLISFLIHAFLLTLQFDISGLGMPKDVFGKMDGRGAEPMLSVVLAPSVNEISKLSTDTPIAQETPTGKSSDQKEPVKNAVESPKSSKASIEPTVSISLSNSQAFIANIKIEQPITVQPSLSESLPKPHRTKLQRIKIGAVKKISSLVVAELVESSQQESIREITNPAVVQPIISVLDTLQKPEFSVPPMVAASSPIALAESKGKNSETQRLEKNESEAKKIADLKQEEVQQELQRQDAIKQASIKEETLKQENIKKEAALQEVSRNEAQRQESIRQESLIQESLRQEAVRREAVRQEAAQQELARQNAARNEMQRQEVARQESLKQESLKQDALKQDAVRRETARQEAAQQELARQNAVRNEMQRQEVARQESLKQESLRQDALKQDAVRRETARQEAAQQELVRQNTARNEMQRLETARQESLKQESLRQEALKQDAVRREIARQEAAQQELVRQNAARNEMQRLETARQESLKQESLRQEALKQDAVRRETARQEAAQQELARQNSVRNEMQRQEAARQNVLRNEAFSDGRNLTVDSLQTGTKNAQTGAVKSTSIPSQSGVVNSASNIQSDSQIKPQRERLTSVEAVLSARPSERKVESTPDNSRRLTFGRMNRDVRLLMLAEGWRQKVEQKADFELLRSAKTDHYVDPIVKVAVRRDGSVESIEFSISSGVPAIDDAVRKVIEKLAPFEPLPADIAIDYDVVEYKRIWTFGDGLRLVYGGR